MRHVMGKALTDPRQGGSVQTGKRSQNQGSIDSRVGFVCLV
jgi:hypothetical protein